MGPDLMDEMRAQAERFGAELVPDDVTAVDFSGDVKTVTDSEGTIHRAKAVIVATGSQHRKLGLPNEDEPSGRDASYCATCDGFFFREHDIAVIGGGDTAIEEATFLYRFAKTVTIAHRRDTLRASKAMQARAFAPENLLRAPSTRTTIPGTRTQRGPGPQGLTGRPVRLHRELRTPSTGRRPTAP